MAFSSLSPSSCASLEYAGSNTQLLLLLVQQLLLPDSAAATSNASPRTGCASEFRSLFKRPSLADGALAPQTFSVAFASATLLLRFLQGGDMHGSCRSECHGRCHSRPSKELRIHGRASAARDSCQNRREVHCQWTLHNTV